MAILGSHHIGVLTPDLPRAEAFYTDVLGLEVAGRLQGPGRNIVFLDLGGTRLELIEDKSRVRAPETGRMGLAHVAMEVDDVYATARELERKGVSFHMAPQDVGDGLHIAFFRDPDGVELELFQRQP